MKKKLLITDLDNTLYDWVYFFVGSFSAMLDELVVITDLDRKLLLDDFKKIHQKHGNTEYPNSILELPSLIKFYQTDDKDILKQRVDTALHAFNSERIKLLRCYDSVVETLDAISKKGIRIVAHTESPVRNSLYRIEKLDLKKYFAHLYAPRDKYPELLDERSINWIHEQGDFLRLISEDERKPNPELLIDICQREGVAPSDAVYIGDSIVKDIAMANQAGVTSVWAEYGKQHSPEYWSLLVSITHWTQEDVEREEQLKNALGVVTPDYKALSFSKLLDLY